MQECTLCGGRKLEKIDPPNDPRHYFLCRNCCLIFADARFYLSPQEEKRRYLHHQNTIDDAGYVAFLQKAIAPTLPFIPPGSTGLDYGSGPSRVLSQLLGRYSISCHNYDPLFGIDHPGQEYDFIFATECFEHFHHPATEMERILQLLKPGGYLCIMTALWRQQEDFDNWHYKRDATHVSFYHRESISYVARKFNFAGIHDDGERVVILRRKS